MFNSWDELNLMDDCKAGEHYHLLSQQNWTKLKSTFGGGPEIPFFQYQVETEVVNEDGTKEIKKESKHDFDPIRVCVHVLKRTKETAEKSLVLLVSKHLTHLQDFRSEISPRGTFQVQVHINHYSGFWET